MSVVPEPQKEHTNPTISKSAKQSRKTSDYVLAKRKRISALLFADKRNAIAHPAFWILLAALFTIAIVLHH